MAENEFSLHVDTDWKKQAQEEKRRLAEEQAKKAAAAAATPAPAAMPTAGPGMMPQDPRSAAAAAQGRTGRRELPQAGFGTLVNSIATQVLYYLGDLGHGESTANLDMAKYQLDTLAMLEDKTRGNLTPDEQKLLDTALYDARSRFVGVASQYINF